MAVDLEVVLGLHTCISLERNISYSKFKKLVLDFNLMSGQFEYHEFISENVVPSRCTDIDPLQPEKSEVLTLDLEMPPNDRVAKPDDWWLPDMKL